MRMKGYLIALSLSLLLLSVMSRLSEGVRASPPDPAGESQLGVPVSAEAGPIELAYTGCGGVTAPRWPGS